MKNKTGIAVLLLTLLVGASGARAQQPDTFYSSGNAFLSHCDENDATFAQYKPAEKQQWTIVCDFWVLGIRQATEMSEQIRPAPSNNKDADKSAKEYQAYLESVGIKPNFSIPTGNMCVPDDVTTNQLRLVVVKWMRDNPTKLTQFGGWLVYAALKNTYACSQ